MRIRQFTLSEFIKPGDNASAYPMVPRALKVCCVCRSDDPEDIDLNDWIETLTNEEISAFRNGMCMILKLANAGKRLENHYDEKKCHPTHHFKHDDQEQIVWRVRNSDVRLLFYYGKHGILLMVDAFSKRTKTLTKAQKSHAESVIKSYLEADEVTIIGAKNEQ